MRELRTSSQNFSLINGSEMEAVPKDFLENAPYMPSYGDT